MYTQLRKLIIPAFATRMVLMVRSRVAAYFLRLQKEGKLQSGKPLVVLCHEQDQHMCNIIYIYIYMYIISYS